MLLQVHAKQCQRADCPVPRCKELREMRRRAVVRQEDQRRVAYKNMVSAAAMLGASQCTQHLAAVCLSLPLWYCCCIAMPQERYAVLRFSGEATLA